MAWQKTRELYTEELNPGVTVTAIATDIRRYSNELFQKKLS